MKVAKRIGRELGDVRKLTRQKSHLVESLAHRAKGAGAQGPLHPRTAVHVLVL